MQIIFRNVKEYRYVFFKMTGLNIASQKDDQFLKKLLFFIFVASSTCAAD